MFKSKVFVIAEAGSNWRMGTARRDLAMAKALVDAAVDAGADAVKFQTYRAETVYVPNAGMSDYLSKARIRESITDIFKDLAMPYEMIPRLAHYCRKQKIQFMSSFFSPEDFKAVNPFVQIHKIASYEISHPRLLTLAAFSGKPLILSTGASTLSDIDWAVRTYRKSGGKKLSLMQCTAKYPAPLEALNLKTIPTLIRRFRVPVGLSDHSEDPVTGPVAAVALGAALIEKHYTLDKRLPGPDHAFAVTPNGLKHMVRAIRDCERALGDGRKVILPDEKELRAYAKRAVQATRNIAKGERFKEGINISILRPGKQKQGVHPRFITKIQGRKARRAVGIGQGIQRGDYAAPA